MSPWQITRPKPIGFGLVVQPALGLAWPSHQILKQMKTGNGIKEDNFLVATQTIVFLDESVSVFHEIEQNVSKMLQGSSSEQGQVRNRSVNSLFKSGNLRVTFLSSTIKVTFIEFTVLSQ